MSLRQKVKLELEDGRELEVIYDGRDLRAWETAFDESALAARMSVTMLTWLGHHAAVRQEIVNGDLTAWKDFDAACVSVQGVPDDGGPTKKPGRARTRSTASGD